MIERRHGGILNVASAAAFQPGPLMSVYYATKAYVLHFTEGLAVELAGTGVTATCLCPGPTDTEFGPDSHMDRTLIHRIATMQADVVARAGYAGFRRGKTIVIPGLLNKILTFSVRLSPRAAVRQVAKLLHS
jgi:short-subunit dehydrogenase